ncbi:MAG: GtrA family protein [Novosphingobium sp.]
MREAEFDEIAAEYADAAKKAATRVDCQPREILDFGSGAGNSIEPLQRAFPEARLTCLARAFGRYSIAGLFNTVVGLVVITIGLRMGAGDYLANLAGYACGLPLSYLLGRKWVFRAHSSSSGGEVLRFLLSAFFAYSANIYTIYLARSMGQVDSLGTHVASIAAYSVVFFLLSRFFVFRELRAAE